MRRALLALSLAACSSTDRNCTEWTEAADACLQQAGEPAPYVATTSCDASMETEAINECLLGVWQAADCTSAETVATAEAQALECMPKDLDCVSWTEAADACLETSGQEPAYVAGVSCAQDPSRAEMHECLVALWADADCSTPDTVSVTEREAAETCVPTEET